MFFGVVLCRMRKDNDFFFYSSFVPDVSGQALTQKKQLSAAISFIP
jgi:hypothetical protein